MANNKKNTSKGNNQKKDNNQKQNIEVKKVNEPEKKVEKNTSNKGNKNKENLAKNNIEVKKEKKNSDVKIDKKVNSSNKTNNTSKKKANKESALNVEKKSNLKEEVNKATNSDKIEHNNNQIKKIEKNTKTTSKAKGSVKKKENKEKSKEEEIVFKNVKTTKKTLNKPQGADKKEDSDNKNKLKESVSKEIKEDKNKEKPNKVNNINTEEFFEEKKNKKRKAMFIALVIFVILAIILCFSTIFAIMGSFKTTIARGVKINGVDISNLTYEEAKNKLTEVINVQSMPSIDLVYGDYKYTIKFEDISYKYDLSTALDTAYSVGKKGNIIENNYWLIKTAIFGEDVKMNASYDEASLDAIIDIIDTNIPGRVKQYSYYIEGTNLIVNPGVDGIEVKNEELKNTILTSIQNRNYLNILDNYKSIEIEIPCENVVADKIDASKIADDVYAEPQNAYYVEATETTDFEIYPAKDGVALAITAEEAQIIIDSEIKNEYIIPLTITPAEIQLNDIGVEAFPYKIQTFSTSYDASNYSRSKNLEIAANKINGTVLMPGEIFSFNNVVGERTVAEGYRNAKIYSNGQVVDGLAGGICQISSTLYNVVLLSNLEIVERFNHSFTTTYVAAGRDATVVYGIKDFKFKNSRNYPIKIEASVANGIATFSIYGIKEENEYTVKIIPKTTQTIPYTTQTIIDSTLAPGTMKVTQAGASGRKVTTYKETYLDGVLVSSEVISNDVYQVMTRIVRANPAVEVPPAVAPETTPTVVPEANVTQ